MKARTVKHKYTIEAIENIIDTLKSIPMVDKKKHEVSKTEAVGLLSKEIKSLQDRGYTMKMIADILTDNSFEISEGVLKSYLARTSGSKTIKKKQPESKATAKDIGVGNTVTKKPVTQISDVD